MILEKQRKHNAFKKGEYSRWSVFVRIPFGLVK